MRNDVCWKDWMIWAEGALQDDFLESVFFTGNGRMGVRGYAAGDPQPRPVRQGLFLAGMFDEIKPGITDFIHLPTPVWHRILAGGPALAPHLPDGWQGLHFRFYWHGATYCADVCRDPAGGVQTSLVFCEE